MLQIEGQMMENATLSQAIAVNGALIISSAYILLTQL